MKKKALIGLAALTGVILLAVILSPRKKEDAGDGAQIVKADPAKRPLNVSVYIDLSDRLTRPMPTPQADRDTAIIMHLASLIKDHAVKQKILPSKDRIKVFFYPAPNDPKVALLSEELELDLAKTNVKEKKKRLITFEDEFRACLSQIYSSTIAAKNWVGSDIWGFFNKQVDDYCIRKGSRNILVILTDGYIYHKNNQQKSGEAYSYILPQTLANPNSSLIVNRTGLEELEVLILEVNPYDPKQEQQLETILLNWLKGMGIQKPYVGETDMPSNTRLIIDNFLDIE